MILDPTYGPQDPKKNDPKCAKDDNKDCKPGEIAETRTSNDKPGDKKKCGKKDPNDDNKKCNKKQYEQVTVVDNPDGTSTAKKTCKQNKKYEDNKKKRKDEVKKEKQKKWDTNGEERKKKKEERKKSKDKWDEDERNRQNKQADDARKEGAKNKKKERLGKCLPIVALMSAVAPPANVPIPGVNGVPDNVYEYTTEWFDENFVESDDILEYWPADLEIDDNSEVDENAFKTTWGMWKAYEDCEKRVKVRILAPGETAEVCPPPPSKHRKRFFNLIVVFLRVALQVAVDTVLKMGSIAARIGGRFANLLKSNGNQWFRYADKGKAAARQGVNGMKQAAKYITKNKHWRNCLQKGRPLNGV